jgi:5-methylcytosine-specific restriction endonuclease McrA
VCGKSFAKKHPTQKYCSSNCCKKNWKINHKEQVKKYQDGYNKGYWQKIKKLLVEKRCIFCGEIFLPNRTTPYQKYCSEKCRSGYWKANNREKYLESKRREKEKHYETYIIRGREYRDKIMFGGNRKKAMQRDNFECQHCRKGYPEVTLCVHHIDHSGTSETPNQELDNLQTLCRACHARIHKKPIL